MSEKIGTLIRSLFANMALSGDDVVNILFSMILALLIGVIISQVYKHTQRGMSHEQTFVTSLVLLAPIVCLVMLFIRGNLILSLGLIGSLSIVRFRSPIKDTRDMVFLFWSIVVGLGTGTNNWTVTILGSIVVVAAIFVLYLVKYGRSQNQDYVLVLGGENQPNFSAVQSVIQQYAQYSNIRSQELHEAAWEMVLELGFKAPDGLVFENLVRDLKALDAVGHVSLLAPQLSLPA